MIQQLFPTTDRRSKNRAVTEVIGFILLFGLVMAGISLIQVYGVPAQNERIEFDHNIRMQDDMTVFADNIETSGLTGSSVSTTLETGTDYPSRLFLFNPAAPIGKLRLGEQTTVSLSNATADGEIGDYWDGTERTFTTRPVVYRPSYNVYRSAPETVIEHGVVYNDNPTGAKTVLKRGSLVRGDRISLVTVDGSFDRGGAKSMSLESVPLSAPSQTITVAPSKPLRLTLESDLSVEDWQDLLSEEMTTDGGHVTNITSGPSAGTVRITLEAAVSYELRLAHVGIESGYDQSASESVYITPVGSATQTVPEGSKTKVTFEVRDAFNNPVSSQNVTFGTQQTRSSVSPTTVTTDADGRVSVTYTAPTFDGTTTITDRVQATFGPAIGSGFDADTPENASVTFTAVNSDNSGVDTVTSSGQGGESEWTSTDDTETFSQPNGRWKNIGQVEQIQLSNGQMATKSECTGETNCNFVDRLSVDFTLEDDSDGGPAESYTVVVRIRDSNRDGDLADVTGGQDKKDLKYVSIYDSAGGSGSLAFSGTLTETAANNIVFAEDTPVDILDSTVYEDGYTGTLDSFDGFSETEWFTGTIEGRVTVTIN